MIRRLQRQNWQSSPHWRSGIVAPRIHSLILISLGGLMLNCSRILYQHVGDVVCSRRIGAMLIAILVPSLSVLPAIGQDDTAARSAPAAAALKSIFSTSAAPPRKTMGLLQRSFLDVAQRAEQKLEIAVVIDGTDSMETEIAGVKETIGLMIDDLRRGRVGEVGVALVVYRDVGSPSGPGEVLLDRFTSDVATLQQALDRLQPESGAPFFHELPDLGVQMALEQLPWSDDEATSRWLFLFGDAPPYAENFRSDEVPSARRAYATDLLVSLATRKRIQIHSVLCTSGDELDAVYRQAVGETRGFMNALSSGTGGLMLDLSYPDIRQAVVAAGQQPRYEYLEIEPITRQDLIAARDQSVDKPAESDPAAEEVRVAVLPHLPIRQISFDSGVPAVQVAASLQHKLENLPRLSVVSPYDIERQLRRVRAEGIREEQQMRALAAKLRVDYVVWGEVDPSGSPIVSTVYAGRVDDQIIQVSHVGDPSQLAHAILGAQTDDVRFASLQRSQPGMRPEAITDQLQRELADGAAASRDLQAALAAMQQAVGLLADDPRSTPLQQKAKIAAEAVLATEPRNGLAHWLLANIHFNSANRLLATGERDAAQAELASMKRSLGRAYVNRGQIDSLSLRGEVVADHAFLIDRDIPKAIEFYEQLTTNPAVSPSVRRRAHWVLTGIYSGDWNVDAGVVDATKARQHAIAILANWESSPEAQLLGKWLGWDPETDRSEHPFLPRSHGDLAALAMTVDTSS